LITRLVIENLKHRPLRTAISVVAIGVQVAMVLTLVGVSRGMLQEQARQKRGTGADVLVRPPGSSIIGFSMDMPAKIVDVVRGFPEVAQAYGTLVAAHRQHRQRNRHRPQGIRTDERRLQIR